jgi:Cu-Zn family superoxide dismutase
MLSEGPTGVLLRLQLTGLTPGWHGVHFHAKGDCSDAAINNAGSHINHATRKAHGLLNVDGPDFGDLPNV